MEDIRRAAFIVLVNCQKRIKNIINSFII